jgi:hypothetical protein
MSDDKKDKDKDKPASEETVYSLEALAQLFGQVATPTVHGDKYKADHSCAAAVHGWNVYEYHHGTLLISIKDYAEALKAAGLGKVHAPASCRKPRKA